MEDRDLLDRYADNYMYSMFQELNKCQAKADKYGDRDRTGPNIVKIDVVSLELNFFYII